MFWTLIKIESFILAGSTVKWWIILPCIISANLIFAKTPKWGFWGQIKPALWSLIEPESLVLRGMTFKWWQYCPHHSLQAEWLGKFQNWTFGAKLGKIRPKRKLFGIAYLIEFITNSMFFHHLPFSSLNIKLIPSVFFIGLIVCVT